MPVPSEPKLYSNTRAVCSAYAGDHNELDKMPVSVSFYSDSILVRCGERYRERVLMSMNPAEAARLADVLGRWARRAGGRSRHRDPAESGRGV